MRSVERAGDQVTVRGLCGLAGYSRQAYYQESRVRTRQEVDEEVIVALVKGYRMIHPRMGTRKLRLLIDEELQELEIVIGRDRFFALLRKHKLLIRRRRRGMRTTDSRHGWYTWPNLVRNVVPTMISQLWVSDITYLRTQGGFVYLALVMDAYSRKIVGHHVSTSLAAEGCIAALRMAMKGLMPSAAPIHHSDRGLQYCCQEYVTLLQARGCPVSMTEVNHCYENAKAERLNGILKQEYGLGETLRDKGQAVVAVAQSVLLYNQKRPHTALDYRTPASVHAAA